MRRVNSTDNDRLEYRPDVVVRPPFILVGLVVIFGTFAAAPKLTFVFMAAYLLPILALASLFIVGRREFVFDRKARTVASWLGFVFRFKSELRNLSDFEEVTISSELRPSKGGTYTVYPVRLHGRNTKNLDIEVAVSEREARRLAEGIAKFIAFPIVDLSSGTEVKRDANALNESIRERFVRTRQEINVEGPPATLRSKYSATGDCVTFIIPPERFDTEFFFSMLIPVAGMMIIGLLTLFGHGWPKSYPGSWVIITIAVLIFFVIPMAWLVGYMVLRRSLGGTVEVSPDQLQITCKRLLSSRTTVITSEELQELRIETEPTRRTAPARYLLEADSEKEFVLFGHGLHRDELEWIRAVILKAVTK